MNVNNFFIGTPAQNPTGWQLVGWFKNSGVNSGTATLSSVNKRLLIVYTIYNKSAPDEIALRFNGDSGNNYAFGVASGGTGTSTSKIQLESAPGPAPYAGQSEGFVFCEGLTGFSNSKIRTTSVSTINAIDKTNAPVPVTCAGIYDSSGTITSVTLFTAGGVVTCDMEFFVYTAGYTS